MSCEGTGFLNARSNAGAISKRSMLLLADKARLQMFGSTILYTSGDDLPNNVRIRDHTYVFCRSLHTDTATRDAEESGSPVKV